MAAPQTPKKTDKPRVDPNPLAMKGDTVEVFNTEAGLFHLGYGDGVDSNGYAKSNHFTLMPGHNFVPVEVWEKVKKHPVVVDLMTVPRRSPRLQIGKSYRRGALPLAMMSIEDATEFVGETWSDALLAEWLAGEKRAKVREAITAQRAELKPGEK